MLSKSNPHKSIKYAAKSIVDLSCCQSPYGAIPAGTIPTPAIERRRSCPAYIAHGPSGSILDGRYCLPISKLQLRAAFHRMPERDPRNFSQSRSVDILQSGTIGFVDSRPGSESVILGSIQGSNNGKKETD